MIYDHLSIHTNKHIYTGGVGEDMLKRRMRQNLDKKDQLFTLNVPLRPCLSFLIAL